MKGAIKFSTLAAAVLAASMTMYSTNAAAAGQADRGHGRLISPAFQAGRTPTGPAVAFSGHGGREEPG